MIGPVHWGRWQFFSFLQGRSRNAMKGFVTLRELAEHLGVHRTSLWRRVERDGVKPVYGPIQTETGPQRARWVPFSYAEKLLGLYERARLNKEGGGG
jgi:hypothetical protein